MVTRRPSPAPSRPELVRCGIGHAAVIATLHAQCFDECWDRASVAQSLAAPGTFGLIAECDDGPCGFIMCRAIGEEGEILTLGVTPPARGSGVAGFLLDAVLLEAERRGAEALFLEVAANNAAARRLYSSRGFRRIGRRPGYYAREVDALILRRRLDK